MGCATSVATVEDTPRAVFRDEDGLSSPEVDFPERRRSFHSMDDRTKASKASTGAPIRCTHVKWVKQLNSVLNEIEQHPKQLRAVVALKRSTFDLPGSQ